MSDTIQDLINQTRPTHYTVDRSYGAVRLRMTMRNGDVTTVERVPPKFPGGCVAERAVQMLRDHGKQLAAHHEVGFTDLT